MREAFPPGGFFVPRSHETANVLIVAPRAPRYADFVTEELTDYSNDGVDLTLIRWTLSLTPLQRIQFLEERINEILAIRELNAGNPTPFNPSKSL